MKLSETFELPFDGPVTPEVLGQVLGRAIVTLAQSEFGRSVSEVTNLNVSYSGRLGTKRGTLTIEVEGEYVKKVESGDAYNARMGVK